MEQNTLSLFELNRNVKSIVNQNFDNAYWIRAETSDVREHRNGHCYLEFIEKANDGSSIIAKARGTIWSSTFKLLKSYFEEETGQPFATGLTVLVKVTIDLHEVYGYGLNVVDIDPSYTMGEIARNRMLVLKKLEEDGIITLNKELPLAEPLNRIAIISSSTAAGYEDFINQLTHNTAGAHFYTKLFPAIMQGDRSEASVINALEQIYEHKELFDVVVIIRGGGASSDLSCFDSYHLAAHCAQFPLPIISGIGHERDVTVLDAVAHTRVKTPTAAAEFLINRAVRTIDYLTSQYNRLIHSAHSILSLQKSELHTLSRDLYHHARAMVQFNKTRLSLLQEKITSNTRHKIERERFALQKHDHFVALSLPDNMLKRGYSITTINGKTIKSASALKAGDIITTQFKEGTTQSQVIDKKTEL